MRFRFERDVMLAALELEPDYYSVDITVEGDRATVGNHEPTTITVGGDRDGWNWFVRAELRRALLAIGDPMVELETGLGQILRSRSGIEIRLAP